MYEILDNMPESGNFLAIWTYNERVWSCQFVKSVSSGRWTMYNTELGESADIVHPLDYIPRGSDITNVAFISIA